MALDSRARSGEAPAERRAQLAQEFAAIDLARALRDRGLRATACIHRERWVVAVDTPLHDEPVHVHDDQDADFLLCELGATA